MNKNPTIERIREVRHKISEEFDHDPHKLCAHYRELEKKYKEQKVKEDEKKRIEEENGLN